VRRLKTHIAPRAISLLKEWYYRTREANAKSCYPPITTTWQKRGLAWQQVGVGFEQSRCTSPKQMHDWEEAGHQFLRIADNYQLLIIGYVVMDYDIRTLAEAERIGYQQCSAKIHTGLSDYEANCMEAGLLSMHEMLRSPYLASVKSIAEYLRVSPRTIRRWALFHGLPVVRIGQGTVMARRDDLDAWYRKNIAESNNSVD
jgi:excisionase family DNA binding protein